MSCTARRRLTPYRAHYLEVDWWTAVAAPMQVLGAEEEEGPCSTITGSQRNMQFSIRRHHAAVNSGRRAWTAPRSAKCTIFLHDDVSRLADAAFEHSLTRYRGSFACACGQTVAAASRRLPQECSAAISVL